METPCFLTCIRLIQDTELFKALNCIVAIGPFHYRELLGSVVKHKTRDCDGSTPSPYPEGADFTERLLHETLCAFEIAVSGTLNDITSNILTA